MSARAKAVEHGPRGTVGNADLIAERFLTRPRFACFAVDVLTDSERQLEAARRDLWICENLIQPRKDITRELFACGLGRPFGLRVRAV
ncbi:MAG: hypothetical protein ACLPX7_19465 [Xanthobacteraceae bacterium]